MYEDGYFHKDVERLSDEHTNRNFDKTMIWIEKDNDKKLDSDNLITLCSYHHKQAEMNKISKEELSNLIDIPPEGR